MDTELGRTDRGGSGVQRIGDRSVVALLLIAFYLYLVLRNSWLSDDAFITLRVIDNFVHGYGLRWNIAERVQVFTHPLWLMVVTPLYYLTGEGFFSIHILSIAISVSGLSLLLRYVVREIPNSIVTVLCLCGSAAFVDFSTSGLENPLTHLLIITYFAIHLRSNGDLASLQRLSCVAALLLVNRLDCALLVAPSLFVTAYRTHANKSSVLKAVLLGCIPFFAWEIFALVYYGSLLPNTFFAKVTHGIPRGSLIEQGVIYCFNSLSVDPLTLTWTVLAIVGAIISKRFISSVIGITLYLAYVVWVGGDFMAGRFFSAPFLCAVLVNSQLVQVKRLGALALAIGFILLVGQGREVMPWEQPRARGGQSADGIGNEKEWYYGETGLLVWNRSHPLESAGFAQLGRDFQKTPTIVQTLGALGFAGYFAGPTVHIVDYYALADPLLARLPAIDRSTWRIGHFKRAIPAGYLQSIVAKTNLLRAKDEAQLYQTIRDVTVGPLWSFTRMRDILVMNFFGFSSFYPVPTLSAQTVSTAVADGTSWDSNTATILSEQGALFTFEKSISPVRIFFGADHNDAYELMFMRNGTQVGSLQVRPTDRVSNGIASHTLDVPREVSGGGIDSIRVKPSQGDGLYSVAYLIPQPLAQ